ITEFHLDRDNAGAHTLSSRNIQTVYKGSLQVETTTLDDFVEHEHLRPDFIKMDLQGAEGLVIEGSQRVLKQNPHLMIVMEFWPEGLINMGASPAKLLEVLSRLFVIRIVGDAQSERDLGDVLEMAGRHYVNLFLERRIR
ncbi:MAG: FkbM family methyltransferase, partial [Acidobacteria bacterium]|nr:FkbM family methyltransferase [Acidobacteriota bacterium]